MTREEVMTELAMDDEEFDDFYDEVLRMVSSDGTHGVQTMLNFVEQELAAGRAEID